MWHYVLSRIWRNLHRDVEIDRNWRSEKLLKLGGGQKIFILKGTCPMRGANFLGGGSYLSAYYANHIAEF